MQSLNNLTISQGICKKKISLQILICQSQFKDNIISFLILFFSFWVITTFKKVKTDIFFFLIFNAFFMNLF